MRPTPTEAKVRHQSDICFRESMLSFSVNSETLNGCMPAMGWLGVGWLVVGLSPTVTRGTWVYRWNDLRRALSKGS